MTVNDQQVTALIAGMVYASGRETTPLGAVNIAREIMDVIYKTEDDKPRIF